MQHVTRQRVNPQGQTSLTVDFGTFPRRRIFLLALSLAIFITFGGAIVVLSSELQKSVYRQSYKNRNAMLKLFSPLFDFYYPLRTVAVIGYPNGYYSVTGGYC